MANVADAGTSTIEVTEGSGASLVILIAMIILFRRGRPILPAACMEKQG